MSGGNITYLRSGRNLPWQSELQDYSQSRMGSLFEPINPTTRVDGG